MSGSISEDYLPPAEEQRAALEQQISAEKRQIYAISVELELLDARVPGAGKDSTVDVEVGEGRTARVKVSARRQGLNKALAERKRILDRLRNLLEDIPVQEAEVADA